MKKALALLGFISTIAFAGMAMATTWTVDGSNTPFGFSAGGSTYTTILDLNKTGYTVDSAQLILDFIGFGTVNQVGSIDTSGHSVTILNLLTYDVTKFLNNGVLNLSVTGKSSFDFLGDSMSLASVCATVTGQQAPVPSSVPEPGTIVLLGAGLLAVTIYKRRHTT